MLLLLKFALVLSHCGMSQPATNADDTQFRSSAITYEELLDSPRVDVSPKAMLRVSKIA